MLKLDESYVEASDRFLNTAQPAPQGSGSKLVKISSCKVFSSERGTNSRVLPVDSMDKPVTTDVPGSLGETENSFLGKVQSHGQLTHEQKVKIKAAAIQLEDYGVDVAIRSINEGLDNLIKGMVKKNIIMVPEEKKPNFFVMKPFSKENTLIEKSKLKTEQPPLKKKKSTSVPKTGYKRPASGSRDRQENRRLR